MNDTQFKVEAVLAVADLCQRTGAREFEIGYTQDEDRPDWKAQPPDWWCSARYRGARVFIDGQPSPDCAADGLAHRLLDGGTCTHCGETTTSKDTPTGIYVRFGRSKKARCVWWRDGDTWRRGCE